MNIATDADAVLAQLAGDDSMRVSIDADDSIISNGWGATQGAVVAASREFDHLAGNARLYRVLILECGKPGVTVWLERACEYLLAYIRGILT